MRIFVTGGTGKIGRETVSVLQAAGHDAVPASRGGQGGVAIDLSDPDGIALAARGFDRALLIMPIGPDEEALGPRVVQALARALVDRIVAIGIHNVEAMREIPHFAAKIPMRKAVLAAGGTVLECNFFQQNDRLVLPAILHGGVYPMPIGEVGVQPVDVADIAQAAARALTRDDWVGAAVPVCGPERMAGEDYAASWSAVLGRTVRYAGNDVEPFIAAMKQAMPGFDGWFETDFRAMMRVTQAFGCPATPDDVARSEAIVGRPLGRHRDFAAALAVASKEERA